MLQSRIIQSSIITGAGKATFASVRGFVGFVRAQIKSGDLNGALISIRNIVNHVVTEPLCTARVFSSLVLDDLCAQIGLAALASAVPLQNLSSGKGLSDNTVIFVASRLQAAGGHTRVIEDFIRILPHKNKHLLITELVGRSDRSDAESRFGSLGTVIEYAPKGKPLQRLQWLQKRLIELRGQDVYLFNHHEDSVAVAAMEASGESKVHFYHHGDHHLCLGVHLVGANHIDIHAFGYHNCRHNLNVENNCYLPLIAEDLGARPTDEPFRPGGVLTTCTAAGWNKLEIPHAVKYVNVVPLLLATTGGRHIHIGRLTQWARWRIRQAMRKLGVDPSSFIYISQVPSVWQALHQFGVDLYISSFPLTGGRTMVEVMGAGIPIAVHDHPTSRFLGGIDMAYPEAFSWREPEELLTICSEVTALQLKEHSIIARRHYLRFHSPDLLRGFLLEGRDCAPPPLHVRPYVADAMQFALTVGYHTGLLAISRKALHRMYRRVRSW